MSGCFKYEDGPFISLRSKNARITGIWKQVSMTINDNETETVGSVKVEYKKDGTLEYHIVSDGEIIDADGTWEWLDHKNFIIEKTNEAEQFIGYEIMRLANNQLWLEKTVGKNGKIRYKYKKIIEQ